MAPEDDKQKAAELVKQALGLVDKQDWQGVLALMDKAINLDSENDRAWNIRGFAKSELRQYEDAIRDFGKAIEIDPDNSMAVM